MTNRAAIALEPKQPMIEWIRSNDDSNVAIETITDELVLFQVEEVESMIFFDELLKLNWEMFFSYQLHQWNADESVWPKARNYAMFQDWFTIKKFSTIQDLVVDGGSCCDDESCDKSLTKR
jgi:hypothetical protein